MVKDEVAPAASMRSRDIEGRWHHALPIGVIDEGECISTTCLDQLWREVGEWV